MDDLIKQIISLLEEGAKKGLCKPNKDGFTWGLDSWPHYHTNWLINFLIDFFIPFIKKYDPDVRSLMSEILDEFIKSNITKYLFYEEDPNEEEKLNGFWEPVANQTWRIPDNNVDTKALMKFLNLGQWIIYISDEPIQHIHSGLLDFSTWTKKDVLSKYSIKIMIYAGSDNVKWLLSINPDLLKNK